MTKVQFFGNSLAIGWLFLYLCMTKKSWRDGALLFLLMKTFMSLAFLLSVVLTVPVACGPAAGDRTQPTEEEFLKEVETTLEEAERVLADTADAPATAAATKVRFRSAYSHKEDEGEEDNLRGFDPPSEDDMEDNGMRRYMENYDEEGRN